MTGSWKTIAPFGRRPSSNAPNSRSAARRCAMRSCLARPGARGSWSTSPTTLTSAAAAKLPACHHAGASAHVCRTWRSRHQRDIFAARNNKTTAETTMLNRFVARKTISPVKKAMTLVSPPTEAKARTHPAGSARPGRRRRRRIARNVVSASHAKPTMPTRPR